MSAGIVVVNYNLYKLAEFHDHGIDVCAINACIRGCITGSQGCCEGRYDLRNVGNVVEPSPILSVLLEEAQF